jgi:hypothetical protein
MMLVSWELQPSISRQKKAAFGYCSDLKKRTNINVLE